MEFTAEKKKEIERQIVDKVITCLEQNMIQESELSEISAYVLSEIDKVNSREELVTFLRNISSKWSIFSDMLVIESGELEVDESKKKIQEIESLVKNGNIDEAIKRTKQAMEAPTTE